MRFDTKVRLALASLRIRTGYVEDHTDEQVWAELNHILTRVMRG